MLRNAIRVVLKSYVYFTLGVLLISFSSASPFTIQMLQILSGPMLLLYCIQKWLTPHERQPRFLFCFFFLLLAWLLIQQFALTQRFPFFDTPTMWANWFPVYGLLLLGLILYVLVQDVFGTREELTKLLSFWVFVSAAVAAFFVYIFYVSGVKVEATVLPRFLGPFSPVAFQPNNLIDLLLPGLFFSLSIVLYNHRRKLSQADPSRAVSNMMLYLCFACVLLAGMVFTKSRAGILALVIGIGAYWALLIFTNRRRMALLKFMGVLFLVAGLFLCTLGLKEVISELQTIHQALDKEIKTLGIRTLVIGASWKLIEAQGGLGVGLGNFKMGWLLNHAEPFTFFPQVSYNDILWTWAEMGFPGFILFAAAFAVFILFGFKTAYVSKSCFVSFTLIAAMASLIGLLTHSFVDNTFYVPSLLLMTFLFLGVGGAAKHIEEVETQSGIVLPGTTKRIPLPQIGLVLILSIMMSFFSFNQLRAGFLARKDPPSVENLKKAVELDVVSAFYPLYLSNYYRNEYLETKDEKTFQRTLQAIREAIRRDPFQVDAYIARAELYLLRGDVNAIEDSFKMMQQRIPDFYFGHLAACAFYINTSLQLKNEDSQDRFRALGLKHYARALELHPSLNRHRDLYGWLTHEGRVIVDELLSR